MDASNRAAFAPGSLHSMPRIECAYIYSMDRKTRLGLKPWVEDRFRSVTQNFPTDGCRISRLKRILCFGIKSFL
jgi:hypothetical protein